MKYLIISILLILCFSCNSQNYSERLITFKDHYNLSSDSIMFIGLDDCSSCFDFFKESAKEFSKTGIIVIVTSSSKKANSFFDNRESNIVFDKDQIANKLQLIDNFPVVYIKNEFNQIDSLKVRIE